MSRACEITGKKHQTGHNVSHSNIKTKRRFMVNLNNVTLFSESLKRKFRFRIASSTLRTIDKHGGSAHLQKAHLVDRFSQQDHDL